MKTTKSDNGVTVVKSAIESKNYDLLQTIFDSKKRSYIETVTMISESGLTISEKSEMLYYFSSDFEKSKKAVEISEKIFEDEAKEIFATVNKKEFVKAIYKNCDALYRFKFNHPEVPNRCKSQYNRISRLFTEQICTKIEKIREKGRINFIEAHKNMVYSGYGFKYYSSEKYDYKKRYDFLFKIFRKQEINCKRITLVSFMNFLKVENYERACEYLNSLSNFKFKELKDSIFCFFENINKEEKLKAEKIADFTQKTSLPSHYIDAEMSFPKWISGNSKPSGYVNFKGYFLIAKEDEMTDWNAYSKSWHRAHGPKRWIEGRRIEVYQPEKPVERLFIGDRWSNNAIFEALSKRFELKKTEYKGRKQIQLNEYFDIHLTKKINGYEIYERSFAGYLIDHAIFDTKQKVTYHDANKNYLVKGLKAKIQAKAEKETEILNKQFAFDLGFCETGTRQFCELNGIDFEGEYTRQEVRNAIIKNRVENCKRFGWEIRKAGFNINCK